MKTRFILLLAVLLSVAASCNKDDDQPYYPVNLANNYYTFLDQTIAITDAQYYFYEGDAYLYFKGPGTADYVQFIFADVSTGIPTGSFTYHGDRNSGYIPSNNFWHGIVSNSDTPLGQDANGGSIIVTAQPGGTYKITFLMVTPDATATGEYTGVVSPRP